MVVLLNEVGPICLISSQGEPGGKVLSVMLTARKIVSGLDEAVCLFSGSVVYDSCDPLDCSPPSSSVHGIFPAKILEWVANPSSRGSSWPRDRTCVSCIFTVEVDSLPLIHKGRWGGEADSSEKYYPDFVICHKTLTFKLDLP